MAYRTDGRVGFSVGFVDLAGNVGSTATATTDGSRVTIDLIAPALLTVRVSSDNAAESQRANGGDTVTVEITANEDIVAPSVLIADHPASVDGGGISWTAVYTVVADDVSDGEASLSITFEDVAGNSGWTARRCRRPGRRRQACRPPLPRRACPSRHVDHRSTTPATTAASIDPICLHTCSTKLN